ncbi:MAG: peptidoglycan editing factor PgeF [Nitrospirota bacterium]
MATLNVGAQAPPHPEPPSVDPSAAAARAPYRIDTQDSLSRVVVPALEAAGIFHGFGLRGGLRPEGWLAAALAGPVRLATTTQIHSDRIVVVNGAALEPADGLLTDQARCLVGVFTADCLPVLLADLDGRVVGAIHAGWRGLAQRIAGKAVAMMTARWSVPARDVIAVLGPCIGRCCFEVGDQVLGPLRRQPDAGGIVAPHPERAEGKAMVDLQAWASRQLVAAGVPAEQIHAVELCTRCHPALFSSFRRDGRRKQEMFNGILKPVR